MRCLRRWIICQNRRQSLVWTRCASSKTSEAVPVPWSSKTKYSCFRIKFTISPNSRTGSNSSMNSHEAVETISHAMVLNRPAAFAPSQPTAQSSLLAVHRRPRSRRELQEGRLGLQPPKSLRIRHPLISSRCTTSQSTRTSPKL